MTTSAIVAVAALLVAWRELVRLRAWCAWAGRRFFRFLDALERHMRTSPGDLLVPHPPAEDEEHPTTDELPAELYAMHDEVQAKLEEMERKTRGADQALVCTHWYEQDERDADLEDKVLRDTVRRLGKRARRKAN